MEEFVYHYLLALPVVLGLYALFIFGRLWFRGNYRGWRDHYKVIGAPFNWRVFLGPKVYKAWFARNFIDV